jgi:hypothetical protein
MATWYVSDKWSELTRGLWSISIRNINGSVSQETAARGFWRYGISAAFILCGMISAADWRDYSLKRDRWLAVVT